MRCKIINKRCLHGSAYLSKFQNCFSIIKMASLTHALIGSGSKRSSPDSRESRLRLVRRECKPLSVTVRASNRSASDRKASVASIETKGKNSSLFSLHLSYKCFVTFRNSRAYFSRFLERLVVKRNETKQFTPSRFSLSSSLSLPRRFREFRAERTAWFIMRRVNWKHLQFRRFPHCGFAIDPSASINMPRYTISGLRQVYYPGHDGKIATRVIPVLLINFPRSRSHLTPVGNCRPRLSSIDSPNRRRATFDFLSSLFIALSLRSRTGVYLPYIFTRAGRSRDTLWSSYWK